MSIQQVSIFMENRPGRLAGLLAYLAEQNIDMRAYSFAETSDFGIMRLLVCDAKKAEAALKAGGYTAKKTEVLGLLVQDSTGVTVKAFRVLGEAGINIEYSYAFAMQVKGSAIVMLRVDDNARAAKLLTEAGMVLAKADDLF